MPCLPKLQLIPFKGTQPLDLIFLGEQYIDLYQIPSRSAFTYGFLLHEKGGIVIVQVFAL